MAQSSYEITDAEIGSSQPSPKRVISKFVAPPADVCQKCDKRVYDMEKITAGQMIFHKSCFRCTHCNRILSMGTFTVGDNKPYCQPHYISLFKQKGKYDFKALEKQQSDEVQQQNSRTSSVNDAGYDDIDSTGKAALHTEKNANHGPDGTPPEARRFHDFGDRRAKFATGEHGSVDHGSRGAVSDIMLSGDSVKSRMAKYAAMQAERAAKISSSSHVSTPTVHKSQKQVQSHSADDNDNYISYQHHQDQEQQQQQQQQQQRQPEQKHEDHLVDYSERHTDDDYQQADFEEVADAGHEDTGEHYATEYHNDATEYHNDATEYQNDSTEYQNDATEYQNDATEYQNDSTEYQNGAMEYQDEVNEKYDGHASDTELEHHPDDSYDYSRQHGDHEYDDDS